MLAYALTLLLVSQCHGGDLVDTLAKETRASTLVQLVTKAGLVDALRTGTHTVFAPTDAAFARIPSDQLVALTLDVSALTKILLYHVADGSIKSSDIRNEQQLTMLDGNKTRLNDYTHNHLKTINGAKIVDADIAADNGMVHFIDEVIMPASGSIVDAVKNNPQFSTLLTAISKAGIANEFLANPLTVFAPTNDAFSKVDSGDLNKLLGSKDRLKGGDVTVNNAHVKSYDVQATNGVIHSIDHVLIPIRVAFWLRTNIGK